jgi:hypothetical protein
MKYSLYLLIVFIGTILISVTACSKNTRLRQNLHIDLKETGVDLITSQTLYDSFTINKLFPAFEV